MQKKPTSLNTGVPRKPAKPASPDPVDLAFMPVHHLAELVRTRQVSPVELVRLYLERCRTYDPKLHCIVTLTDKLALEQAKAAEAEIMKGRYRGPLHGIPWGAKDLLATKGIPTTWGAKPYENQVFDYDATVVERLRKAGAVLVAKLSMGELAQGPRWFRETTRNPWDTSRASSGSSAGPGAATSAGLVGFSIGTETLGSIISPSSTCGVVGLRPSFGRVSRHGAMALSWSMDKIGPMCRSVTDCALVLKAIYGPDGHDPTVAEAPFGWNPATPISSMRIGYVKAEFDAIQDEEPRKIFSDALNVLKAQGARLEPIELPDYPYQGINIILSCEAAAAFDELTRSGKLEELAAQGRGDWPNTFRSYRLVPAVDYIKAQRVRTMLMRDAAKVTEKVDVFLSPGNSFIPRPIGTPPPEPPPAATRPAGGPRPGANRTLIMTNLTGHPSVVVPCGFRQGLPIGLIFTSNLYDEGAALRLALAYESATEWHKRRPPL
jgi:Asp-tRNA(Asn)/Glu-tRNA(Gln) amidotransferase A subunit family amidase